MKWVLQKIELLRQPLRTTLNIQHALFDAYLHDLEFDVSATNKKFGYES